MLSMACFAAPSSPNVSEDEEDDVLTCFPIVQRSRSFGTSVSKAITDAVNRLEEMSHESRNKQFHKLFKFIPEDEGLIVSFSCALLRDILLQGRLYLSENWVCFHSNIFTFETQVSVAIEDIENITKERTVFVVPNAIGIHTNSHKYVFGSLLSRHSTYKQLVRIWQRRHLLDETTSQESGSRRESEPEVIDGEEDVTMEAGTEADIDEDEDDDDGHLESPEDPEGRLLGDIHVHHAQHSDSETRRTPFRNSSSTTQQIHPSMVQIILAQILTLIQALLAINIYKSLRRFIRVQPFVAFSALLFFVLTTSAIILGYKIITFRSTDENLLKDATTQLSSLGSAFLSHHQQSHEKVNRLQERLVNQLQAMVQDTDAPSNSADAGS